MGALLIESIEVRPTEIEALVRVTEERFMRTSGHPDLAEKALHLMPDLARHRCENNAGLPVYEELADTETPHLLEHIAMEIMVITGSPRTLKGETSWDFSADGRGVFRVHIGYDNDLVALGALRLGVEVVDWLMGEGARPELYLRAARLRAIRRG